MPLIFAHPAAVIPLAKPLGRHASLSALVIGSMCPDFPYLLPLGVVRMHTHDPLALLWFCLPVGLVAYGLFHVLLAPVCARLLPRQIASSLPPASFLGRLPKSNLVAVLLCLMTGAFSHLLVDSATHRDGHIVALLPFLQLYVGQFAGSKFYVFKILQHVLGIIGIGMIAIWIKDWMRRTPPSSNADSFRLPRAVRIAGLCLLIAVPIGAGIIGGIHGWPPPHRTLKTHVRARSFLMVGGSTFFAGWMVMGLLVRRSRPDSDSE